MRFWIIWPEARFVPAAQIRRWYFDAVANDQIAPEYLDEVRPERMAEALSDAGLITLGQSI